MKLSLLAMLILLSPLIVVTTTACEDTIIHNVLPAAPDPVKPVVSRIEYRVSGNPSSAIIRYSNIADGLVQVITTLPYVIRFATTDTFMFLSLEATPTDYPDSVAFPFLSVQILVDGNLFREATASSFFLNTVSVAGTWRKELLSLPSQLEEGIQ